MVEAKVYGFEWKVDSGGMFDAVESFFFGRRNQLPVFD